MEKLIKKLKKQIEADFGKKCKDFAIGCAVCQAYLALEILEDLYEVGWKKLKKPKK